MKIYKNKIKVSIVIPIYNAEKYLEKCLASIEKQTYEYFEVIMINDGSTDSSRNICNRFIKDDRFRLYNQNNQGVSASRNNGMEKCTGEYISFIDSDDFIETDYLENLVNICDCHTDLAVGGIIYHNEYKLRYRNQNQKRLPLDNSKETLNVYEEYLIELKKRIPEPCFGAPYGKLYNKAMIYDNNIRFETGENLAEDLVFNLKILQCATIVRTTNYAGYYYRMFVTDSLSRIVHSYNYTNQRWKVVAEEYNRLYGQEQCDKGERISSIVKKNICLSVMNDKSLNYVKKKKVFYSVNQNAGCNQVFWFEFLKVMLTNQLRKIYRGLQLLVFNVRSIKG